MSTERLLPLGISDYRTIVEENYLYVDKTMYIEKLEKTSPFTFLLRPRRFGKTLFTSTLEHYYGINYKDDFEHLFGDTHIGRNPTRKRNSYYVLKFSFTGLKTDSKEELVESFRKSTLISYKVFCEKYNIDLEYSKNGEPADILNEFVADFKGKTGGQLFVIIDEYDHFANELLSFQTDLFSKLVTKTGFVRKWYEIIKEHTATGTIQRFFATGVSPITLDSLTSGFNIATDLTRHYWFNESLGFTDAEVRSLIDSCLSQDLPALKKEQIFNEMKKYYDGYLFNKKASMRLFNSNMTLRYLSEYALLNEPPEELLDSSIASDYSKMSKLFALKDKSSNYKVVEEILEGEPQHTVITPQFSLEKRFDKNDFRSLLFYLGYLTIGSFDGMRLDLVIPNYVVKKLYFSYFEDMLKEEYKYNLEKTDYGDALWLIAKDGDNSELVACLETILGAMSNRDAIGMDEKRLQAICFAICMPSSNYYSVESENEANKGYVDLQLMKLPDVNVNYNAMIEFKYLSKADGTEANINKQLADAKGQLAKYSAAPKFKDMDNLKKWALVFVGDKCVRNVEV